MKKKIVVYERNKPFKCEVSNYSYAQKNDIKKFAKEINLEINNICDLKFSDKN